MYETGIYSISRQLVEAVGLDNFNCIPNSCSDEHELAEYQDINNFLKEEALKYDEGNLSRTFLYIEHDRVVGFFTTAASLTTIKRAYRKAKQILSGSVSDYSTIDIVYFAIDRRYQGSGYGKTLMKYVLNSLYKNVIPFTGDSLVTVQALQSASDFYQGQFQFEPHASKNHKGKQDLALTISEIKRLLYES
ncbi:GNAT family N-acetyltransferase [Secundilactobacillus yichangensis]|uniref:GNAT family N-acetyltransferase n=1 Tax=Secundilactobacillus yichangensis TaxID=2799580 RepID=UPI001944AE0B|nr:GNAT family N-acetyltransferase [Secundilactobacillus yichangensis]